MNRIEWGEWGGVLQDVFHGYECGGFLGCGTRIGFRGEKGVEVRALRAFFFSPLVLSIFSTSAGSWVKILPREKLLRKHLDRLWCVFFFFLSFSELMFCCTDRYCVYDL